jgi:hypothetical protein
MILFDAVHPRAASTALAFSLRLGENISLVIFGLSVGITATLVLLQRVAAGSLTDALRQAELRTGA